MSDAVSSKGPVVVGIGEALFDLFDGEARLGGAPLNVAVHAHRLLHRLGVQICEAAASGGTTSRVGRGVVVSRIGRDALGNRIVATLGGEGMPVDFLQRDDARPTGRVTVEKHVGGGHAFHIERDAAWDAIAWDEALAALAKQASAVAFGSLAQRGPVARATIQRFVGEAKGAIKLFDVNLRASAGTDFFDAEVLRAGCALADYVKLNEEELETVGRLTGTDSAESLRASFGLEAVILTRGAGGTAACTAEGWIEGAPSEPMASHADGDTVGAGDSCSAALLAGLVSGCSLGWSLDLANRVAAYVAHQPGATPRLPDGLLLDD